MIVVVGQVVQGLLAGEEHVEPVPLREHRPLLQVQDLLSRLCQPAGQQNSRDPAPCYADVGLDVGHRYLLRQGSGSRLLPAPPYVAEGCLKPAAASRSSCCSCCRRMLARILSASGAPDAINAERTGPRNIGGLPAPYTQASRPGFQKQSPIRFRRAHLPRRIALLPLQRTPLSPTPRGAKISL